MVRCLMANELVAAALRIHPDLVLLAEIDPNAHELIVCYANPAAVSLLGRPMSEIIGRPLRTLLVDEPALASPELRKAFFERMREQGTIEFPSPLAVSDGEGGRRNLRLRVRFEPGQARLIAIGEDVSQRRARDEDAIAAARLKASKALSALLSHHVNNALAATLLSVETAREALHDPAGRRGDEDVLDLLDSAAEGVSAAAQVLVALAATQILDTEAAESSDLACALRIIVDSLAPRLQLSLFSLTAASDKPVWVWGGAEQVHAILTGVLAHAARHAPGECAVTLSRDAENVRVQVRVAQNRAAAAPASASLDDETWLRPLLDPAGAYPGLGSSSVRLFASTLVLDAIGGRLELPSLQGNDAAIEVCFRAAPGHVARPERPVRVLLVSQDGALRVAVTTLLAPWPVEHGDSLREGVQRIIGTDGGVVICDVDSLGVTAPQLLAFERAMADLGANRLIVTSRKPPLEATTGMHLAMPFSREQLLQTIRNAPVERARRSR